MKIVEVEFFLFFFSSLPQVHEEDLGNIATCYYNYSTYANYTVMFTTQGSMRTQICIINPQNIGY